VAVSKKKKKRKEKKRKKVWVMMRLTYPCSTEAGEDDKCFPGDIVNDSWRNLHNDDWKV
jgi:hypothetical protein